MSTAAVDGKHRPVTGRDADYLPPMGKEWLLPLYDPLTRLVGVGRVHRRLVAAAGVRPGHRVLEIGCGTGFVLSALHAQRRFQLVGAEQHIAGLRFARERLPEVEFVQLDARRLPYRCEFDAIGAFDVIEHIDEDEEVMASAHAALRPRGLFVLTVPQHAWLWSSTDDYAHHKRRYSRAELLAKMRRRGFAIRFCTSFVFTLLPLMYLSRLGKGRVTPEVDSSAAPTYDELRLQIGRAHV